MIKKYIFKPWSVDYLLPQTLQYGKTWNIRKNVHVNQFAHWRQTKEKPVVYLSFDVILVK